MTSLRPLSGITARGRKTVMIKKLKPCSFCAEDVPEIMGDEMIDFVRARGSGKSMSTLLAIAMKTGCLEEVLRELKSRAGGDGDER